MLSDRRAADLVNPTGLDGGAVAARLVPTPALLAVEPRPHRGSTARMLHVAAAVERVSARARQANSRDRRLWAHVAATLVELYNRGRREVHRLPWSEVPFDAVRQWKERTAWRPEKGR